MSARVVVVTGGSSGIGLATALALSGLGDHLVLVARGREALDRAAEQCRQAGAATVRTAALDVGSAEAVEQLMASVIEHHGRIDAVVNCAAVVAFGRFEEVPAEVFDKVLRTNLVGSANVARAVLPHLRSRNAGSLVLLGSVLGHVGAPMVTPYAITKWGVRALGRQLQIENRDRPGVHVCVIAPGGVDTPIWSQAANYEGHAKRPPPPVLSPERVARACVRMLDRPRRTVQIGALNPVALLAFALAPPVFDRIVAPLLNRVSTKVREPVDPGTGNVLGPVPDGNRVHGMEVG